MKNLDEAAETVYKMLLERFGEPIGKTGAGVGVKDERLPEAGTFGDSYHDMIEKDRAEHPLPPCPMCGETNYGANENADEDGILYCPTCEDYYVKEELAEGKLNEALETAVGTTWEDLYLEFGEPPTLEQLASFLGKSEQVVTQSLPRWLTVNPNGEVVETGISVPPPAITGSTSVFEGEKKGPTKKTAKSWVKGTKTFKQKIAKAERAGMEDPAAFAAWMQHKATGSWPKKGD